MEILSNETFQTLQSVYEVMAQTMTAVNDIRTSGEQSAEIIKTVDDIAFQTNLLALNAAVEAARVGEAGTGFAVVASEVHHLAQRTAEAAKHISSLIEVSLAKMDSGEHLLKETHETFSMAVRQNEHLNLLIRDIVSYSHKQTTDIGEIHKEMKEVTKRSQDMADSAMETAAASQKINSLRNDMKSYISSLKQLI